jgi:NhaP-type Na+/H+ and K+/H+ antiporter
VVLLLFTAAILAPADAGLGQIIVNRPRVPMRIRQALNVEAGLNDGRSVPFLLFFIALATNGGASGESRLFQYIVEQLGIGVLVGGGVVTLPVLCAVPSPIVALSIFAHGLRALPGVRAYENDRLAARRFPGTSGA